LRELSIERIIKRLLILLVMTPSFAFAWGETGHRAICQIAYDELVAEARVELDRLLALDSDFDSFADSCLFANSPERIRWQDHFINIPRSTQAVTTADCPLGETCTLSAIHSDFLVLLDPQATDPEKLLALKLLGHWVGDVHQPMHVSFQDDRGANSNRVDPDNENASLHGVWDDTILAHNLGDDYREIAADLRGGISELQRDAWQHDSPIDWVNESFQITISPAAGYCTQKQGACWYSSDNMMLDQGEEWRNLTITADYLQLHAPIIELRLQQAGIRLAHLLNMSLKHGNK
jgi:hypothetical protein